MKVATNQNRTSYSRSLRKLGSITFGQTSKSFRDEKPEEQEENKINEENVNEDIHFNRGVYKRNSLDIYNYNNTNTAIEKRKTLKDVIGSSKKSFLEMKRQRQTEKEQEKSQENIKPDQNLVDQIKTTQELKKNLQQFSKNVSQMKPLQRHSVQLTSPPVLDSSFQNQQQQQQQEKKTLKKQNFNFYDNKQKQTTVNTNNYSFSRLSTKKSSIAPKQQYNSFSNVNKTNQSFQTDISEISPEKARQTPLKSVLKKRLDLSSNDEFGYYSNGYTSGEESSSNRKKKVSFSNCIEESSKPLSQKSLFFLQSAYEQSMGEEECEDERLY